MTVYDDKQQWINDYIVRETYFMGIIIISQLARSVNNDKNLALNGITVTH